MAFLKDKKEGEEKKERPVPRADAKPVSGQQQKNLLDERLVRDPETLKALTDEQIVEIAREFRLSSTIKIPNHLLDPNYEYRWVNKTQKNWRRRRGIGWRPISEKGTEGLERFLKKDVELDAISMGTHIDPGSGHLCLDKDLVLCYIPKRIVEAIRKDLSDRQQARMKAPRAVFHDAAKLAGVGSFDKE